jgi:aquaporin Z
MRAMPIQVLGLGIFMISACFFSAMLFSEKSAWYQAMPSFMLRNILMGIAMGATALFIFYSSFTAPSGSQINPAVTLTFLRLGKMCRYDVLFFVFFQILGGTIAVYLMQWLLGKVLIDAPVHSAVTVPGKFGVTGALITELIIAFVTMMIVLFTSNNERLKKYTRIFAGCLVCTWVIVAGPISFASAMPADIWTAFWIYLFVPLTGMLLAAEVYLFVESKSKFKSKKLKNELFEPLEFLL